ncbi:MAG: hypothetical protein ACMZ7B_09780 [Balneola sp.]
MTKEPENLFLLDAVGASVSAFFLGVILPGFQPFFGMPNEVLYILASLACLFAIYSFACFFQEPENAPFFLRIIALINLLYCGLTLVLVFYFSNVLTSFGIAYFVGEILLILALVGFELKSVGIVKRMDQAN